MSQDTTVYYLQMLERPRASSPPLPEGFRVASVYPPAPSINARFYREVGGPWAWRDLLVRSDEDWAKVVNRPEFHTWIATSDGKEVGYFEIEQQDGGNAELVHFGLMEAFIGRGFGRAMLREAIRIAWEMPGTRRVWVHTCTKDHPMALENYRRRGFVLYKTEIDRMPQSAASPQPNPHKNMRAPCAQVPNKDTNTAAPRGRPW